MLKAHTTVSGNNTADRIDEAALMARGHAVGLIMDSRASALASTAVALSPPVMALEIKKPVVPPKNRPAMPRPSDMFRAIGYPPFLLRIRATASAATAHAVTINVRSRSRWTALA